MENQEPEVDVNQLMQIRRDKLAKLKEEGNDPFEITKFNRTHTSKQIVENYDELTEHNAVSQKASFPF